MSPKVLRVAAQHEAAAAVPIEPGVETLRTEVQVIWDSRNSGEVELISPGNAG
jgi:hypothetical protein